jgi:hypothetical protein
MKLPPPKQHETSSTITQTLLAIAGCFALFSIAALAADPGWWFTSGTHSRPAVMTPQVITNAGIITTNYAPNSNAVVVQGQLKEFTARAVDELNTQLTNGAGTTLNTMVSNWAQDYSTNGYSYTNAEPSDYKAMTVGQLKYIGSNVWMQLVAGGYTNTAPSWLAANTNSDRQLAVIGQLKEVFAFDPSGAAAPATPTNLAVALSPTQATLTWSESGGGVTYFIIEESTDGGTTWTSLGTVSGTSLTDTIIGLTPGVDYSFRVSAQNGSGTSAPTSGDAAPVITLATPEGAILGT